jgi:hypothetical protein
MDAQVAFIPHVALLRAEEDRAQRRISATQAQPGMQVHAMVLWLLSDIQGHVECDTQLYQYEFRLRVAQAHEGLEELRLDLLLRTHYYKYKDRFSRGVKANTRLETKIKVVEERTRRTSERYRAARRALVALGKQLNETEWEVTLLPLREEDVRGMPRALFQDPERKKLLMKRGPEARAKAEALRKEAKAKMSWIWRSPGVEEGKGGKDGKGKAGGMNEGRSESFSANTVLTDDLALRMEWGKTRARFLRLLEQLDLLEEEDRRILVFLLWQSGWWVELAGKRPEAPADDAEREPGVAYAPSHPAYTEGNVAYAKRQAARLQKLVEVFEREWVDVEDFISMGRMGGMREEDEEEGSKVEGEAEGPNEVEGEQGLEETGRDEEAVPPRPPQAPRAPPAPERPAPIAEEESDDEGASDEHARTPLRSLKDIMERYQSPAPRAQA